MKRMELRFVGFLAATLAACGGESSTRTEPAPDGPGDPESSEPSPEPAGEIVSGAGVGDGDPEPLGGQSGTDQPGDIEDTPCTESAPLDRSGQWQGYAVADLIGGLVGDHALNGEWIASVADTTLDVSITDAGGGARITGPHQWCDYIRLPIELSLRIGESFARGPVAAELTIVPSGHGHTGVGFDRDAFVDPAQLPDALEGTSGGVSIELARPSSEGAAIRPSATVDWGGYRIGEFGTGERIRHLPLDEVAADCGAAEFIDQYSFSSESELLAALDGQWALCEAERRVPFAGLELRADRTWSAIMADGGLTLGMGFGEEGSVKLSDVSAMNEQPGLFQVDLAGPNWTVPAGIAGRSMSGNTVRIGDTIAVRLNRPVRGADAPELAAGQRAGSAGCASNETQFEPWALDEASVNASLVGSWTICSGGAGTLRFDASGQAEFFDTLGASTRRETYAGSPDTSSDSSFEHGYVGSLRLGAGDGNERWQLVRSAHPVKLQAVRHTISAGQERMLETLVLSALPE